MMENMRQNFQKEFFGTSGREKVERQRTDRPCTFKQQERK